jgi:hypothetical protein
MTCSANLHKHQPLDQERGNEEGNMINDVL